MDAGLGTHGLVRGKRVRTTFAAEISERLEDLVEPLFAGASDRRSPATTCSLPNIRHRSG